MEYVSSEAILLFCEASFSDNSLLKAAVEVLEIPPDKPLKMDRVTRSVDEVLLLVVPDKVDK